MLIPVPQRQPWHLPSSMEPQKRTPANPSTRFFFSFEPRYQDTVTLILTMLFYLLSLYSIFCHISWLSGYQGPDFDWADYLKQCEAEAAPQQCFPDVSQTQFHFFYTNISR